MPQPRFHLGDIIWQVNWDTYFLVTSTTSRLENTDKEHYRFQPLCGDINEVVYRDRWYIDEASPCHWKKVG